MKYLPEVGSGKTHHTCDYLLSIYTLHILCTRHFHSIISIALGYRGSFMKEALHMPLGRRIPVQQAPNQEPALLLVMSLDRVW